MSKFTHIQNNFTAGQFSERSIGRIDWEAYKRGAAEIVNMLPNKDGTISARPGSRREFEITGFSTAVRGFGFEPLSSINRHIVVFKAGSVTTTGGSTDAIVEIYRADGTQMTVNNGLATLSSNTIGCVVDDPDKLNVTQVGDFIFICHNDGSERPFYIRFDSEGSFTLYAYGYNELATNAPLVDYRFIFPFGDRNILSSAVISYFDSGTPEISIAGVSGINLNDLIGEYVQLNFSGESTVYMITSRNLGTGRYIISRLSGPDNMTNGDTTDDFLFPAWSSIEGWPTDCVFFEQRLIWVKGNRIYGSLVGNIFFMMAEKFLQHATADSPNNTDFDRLGYFGPIDNTDAFVFEVTDRNIEWISSGRVLQYGTDRGEWVISGGDQILGPLSVNNKKQTNYGGKNVATERIGDSAVFVSSDGKKIRDFKFNDFNGTHLSDDLNDFSEDIVDFGFDGDTASDSKEREFKRMVYQSSRDTLWTALDDNDELLTVLVDKNPDRPRIAWAYHQIQGTNVEILSLMAFRNPDEQFVDLYMLLKRDIDGSTELVVEKIGSDFTHDLLSNSSTNDDDRCWTLDGAVRKTSGSATTSYTVSEYPNETLDIIADGIYVGQKTANGSGEITLDTAASEIIVGFKFEPRIKFLPIEMGGDFGSAMMQKMKLIDVNLRLLRSKSCTIRSVFNNFDDSVAISSNDNELFTGDVVNHKVQDNSDSRGQLELKVDKPYPFTLLSIGVKGTVNVG